MDQLGVREDGAAAIQQLVASAQDASWLLNAGTRAETSKLVRSVVHRVVVHRENVELLEAKRPYAHVASSSPVPPSPVKQSTDDLIHLEFAARLRRSGLKARLVVSPKSPEATPPRHSQALLKAVARAHD